MTRAQIMPWSKEIPKEDGEYWCFNTEDPCGPVIAVEISSYSMPYYIHRRNRKPPMKRVIRLRYSVEEYDFKSYCRAYSGLQWMSRAMPDPPNKNK